MGISDKHHYNWLTEAILPKRQEIREALPARPQVLGLGEHRPSALIKNLLDGTSYDYVACDLFPPSSDVLPCNLNDLSPFAGKIRANIICLFRSSYFINDKDSFFFSAR